MDNGNTGMLTESQIMALVPNSDLYSIEQPPYLWNVNTIDIGDTETSISGWSLPHFGNVENTKLVVNGLSFTVSRDPPSSAYKDLYPWWPQSEHSGFRVTIPRSEFDFRSVVEINMECHPLIGVPAAPSYSLDILVSDLDFDIPDKVVAARIGVTEPLYYTMFGRAIYRGLEKALTKNFGTNFSNYQSIVDWGCGSARVARHVVGSLSGDQKFTGFDIDAPAIEWSNSTVGPYFEVCNLSPPLTLSERSVDLVYAYSVFTHLADQNFRTWLKEIWRILKPGGIALFTVLSERSMITLLPNMDRSVLEKWNQNSIYDSALNDQLDTIEISGDYYRNVWIKHEYLSDALGNDFELIDFVGCFHFYQDLVVVRKR